jgi:phosphatidate cytidylyltransferase
MLGRTLGVVAAFALLGGLLVVAQGQADRDRQGSARSGGQTSWLKYLVFLLVVLGMLAAARLGGAAFVVTILALLAVVLVECFRPLGLGASGTFAAVVLGTGIGVSGLAFGAPGVYGAAAAAALMVAVVGSVSRDPRRGATAAAWTITGLLVVATPGAHLLLLSHDSRLFPLFALLFLAVAGADAFAELVGRRWPVGRGFVRASPAKTVSGLVAGLAAGLAIALALAGVLPSLHPAEAVAGATVAVVAGAGGDLVASSFKRAHAIKDFASWLPAHGGVLDRFDSLLVAAAPYYWLLQGMRS